MKETEQLLECPVCGQTFDIGNNEPGHDWTCPACGRTFAVQEDDDQTDAAEESDRGFSPSPKGNPPEAQPTAATDGRPQNKHFQERAVKVFRAAKAVAVRACVRARNGFLRLPERARWAVVVSSLVLVVGIVAASGHGSENDSGKKERHAAADAVVSSGKSPDTPKKSLSESAKRQIAIAIAAPTASSIIRDRILSVMDMGIDAKAKKIGRSIAPDEKRELRELADATYATMMAHAWSDRDLSDCPQEFRDAWNRAVTRFSQNSAARLSLDETDMIKMVAFADSEQWRKEKDLVRRKTGTGPSFPDSERLLDEMTGSIIGSVRDLANESDLREIVAMVASKDIVDAAHKSNCGVADTAKGLSPTKTQDRSVGGNGSATPEELCEEFASGGSHFVRKSATTVWWDVGGETPRFTCEVSFLPGGKARLTQDNTFYAYEEKNRSTSPQVLARRLQAAYDRYQGGSSEVKNVRATVSSDGRLLFSGEISVERGNVSKQIGKVFSALNEARLASRLN